MPAVPLSFFVGFFDGASQGAPVCEVPRLASSEADTLRLTTEAAETLRQTTPESDTTRLAVPPCGTEAAGTS